MYLRKYYTRNIFFYIIFIFYFLHYFWQNQKNFKIYNKFLSYFNILQGLIQKKLYCKKYNNINYKKNIINYLHIIKSYIIYEYKYN